MLRNVSFACHVPLEEPALLDEQDVVHLRSVCSTSSPICSMSSWAAGTAPPEAIVSASREPFNSFRRWQWAQASKANSWNGRASSPSAMIVSDVVFGARVLSPLYPRDKSMAPNNVYRGLRAWAPSWSPGKQAVPSCSVVADQRRRTFRTCVVYRRDASRECFQKWLVLAHLPNHDCQLQGSLEAYSAF